MKIRITKTINDVYYVEIQHVEDGSFIKTTLSPLDLLEAEREFEKHVAFYSEGHIIKEVTI